VRQIIFLFFAVIIIFLQPAFASPEETSSKKLDLEKIDKTLDNKDKTRGLGALVDMEHLKHAFEKKVDTEETQKEAIDRMRKMSEEMKKSKGR